MFKTNQQREKTMDICLECGEDLKLDSNDFLTCDDKNCQKSSSDIFNQIDHIEQQNLLNQMMDNS